MTKRKKWLAVIIALCTILLFMSGCAVEENEDHESSDMDVDEEIQEETYEVPPLVFLERHELEADSNRTFFQIIFYDPETLIMYTYVEWIDGGGFVEMHNKDGSPRLYIK